MLYSDSSGFPESLVWLCCVRVTVRCVLCAPGGLWQIVAMGLSIDTIRGSVGMAPTSKRGEKKERGRSRRSQTWLSWRDGVGRAIRRGEKRARPSKNVDVHWSVLLTPSTAARALPCPNGKRPKPRRLARWGAGLWWVLVGSAPGPPAQLSAWHPTLSLASNPGAGEITPKSPGPAVWATTQHCPAPRSPLFQYYDQGAILELHGSVHSNYSQVEGATPQPHIFAGISNADNKSISYRAQSTEYIEGFQLKRRLPPHYTSVPQLTKPFNSLRLCVV